MSSIIRCRKGVTGDSSYLIELKLIHRQEYRPMKFVEEQTWGGFFGVRYDLRAALSSKAIMSFW
jgi:hypothetical protein